MEQLNLRNRTILILVVTGLLVWAFLGWQVRLGQDLRGGTTLRFSLDLDRAEATGAIDPGDDRTEVVRKTIEVIQQRIDRYGLSETGLTPLGTNKFEISLPAGTETEGIVDVVTQLGKLQLMIEVLPTERYPAWKGETPPRLLTATPPWTGTAQEFDAWKKEEVERWKKARDTATAYHPSDPRYIVFPARDSEAQQVTDFHVLEVSADKDYRFDGGMIRNPAPALDETGRPVVRYDVKTEYQNVFGEWTDANRGLPMAIVLNERWVSAPQILSKLTGSVQVTLGTGSTSELQKEAESLATVLQTGSLKVRPKLESETRIGARLAGESKQRGILAIIVAFMLVLLFMVVYYKWSGLIANVALLLNVVLLVGALAFFQATLTLPGIAGIVLTLGMAVDANILINERIREERLLGRSLRRAVSEGYDRAFTTIVDANATSLITAGFLYAYGSGPVRGFAITLAIGLISSMFTAIYVTRTMLEAGIRSGRFQDIRMLGSGAAPSIPWLKLRRFFAPISAAGVFFGLIVYGVEDKTTFYDVDFTGGLKLQARFTEATSVDVVKRALRSDAITVTVNRDVQDENGDIQTVTRQVQAGPYRDAEVMSVGGDGLGVEVIVQEGVGDEAQMELDEQGQAFKGYVQSVLAARLRPGWFSAWVPTWTAPEDATDRMKAADGGAAFSLTLVDPTGVVTPERLEKALASDMPYYTNWSGERVRNDASTVKRVVVVTGGDAGVPGLARFGVLLHTEDQSGVRVETEEDKVRATLAEFLGSDVFAASLQRQGVPADQAAEVELSQPFPSLDLIGSSVAEKLKDDALLALALSLLGIIVYVALRFSSRAMGFSAVLCLFHDVAVTLGVVAVANMLGWVDAKINLPMVAAFLTLVGYSVNDTVVVFDRIRENRGKKPEITPDIIDLSINQTLARSIKTSATFLLACVALFAFNVGQRNVLEGFSFLLIVGSIVGTYSTVAIASPLLVFLPWFWQRVRGFAPSSKLVTLPASKAALLILVPVAALLWAAWGLAFIALTFLAGLVLFPVWALTVPISGESAPSSPAAALSA